MQDDVYMPIADDVATMLTDMHVNVHTDTADRVTMFAHWEASG